MKTQILPLLPMKMIKKQVKMTLKMMKKITLLFLKVKEFLKLRMCLRLMTVSQQQRR